MKTYRYKTYHKLILGDLHTPVSTYLKVRDFFSQSALMESSDYHGGENSRSFIGLHPIASIGINHGKAILRYPDNYTVEHTINDSYRCKDVINEFIRSFDVKGEFKDYCGLYGYTSFNAVRYFENIPVADSRDERNDAPDLLYILYKYIIVFNASSTKWYCSNWLAITKQAQWIFLKKPSETAIIRHTISMRSARQQVRLPTTSIGKIYGAASHTAYEETSSR